MPSWQSWMCSIMTDNQPNKTFAFIDASNLIYGARGYGWSIDFLKFHQYLSTRFSVVRFLYFAGLDKDNEKQVKFYKFLQRIGYELYLVPVKTFSSGKKKADVDSRMTFEMMRLFPNYTSALIFTGDGDFYWIIEYLLNTASVKLISFPKQTAKELKQLLGSNFSNLDNWKTMLKMEKKWGSLYDRHYLSVLRWLL